MGFLGVLYFPIIKFSFNIKVRIVSYHVLVSDFFCCSTFRTALNTFDPKHFNIKWRVKNAIIVNCSSWKIFSQFLLYKSPLLECLCNISKIVNLYNPRLNFYSNKACQIFNKIDTFYIYSNISRSIFIKIKKSSLMKHKIKIW